MIVDQCVSQTLLTMIISILHYPQPVQWNQAGESLDIPMVKFYCWYLWSRTLSTRKIVLCRKPRHYRHSHLFPCTDGSRARLLHRQCHYQLHCYSYGYSCCYAPHKSIEWHTSVKHCSTLGFRWMWMGKEKPSFPVLQQGIVRTMKYEACLIPYMLWACPWTLNTP